MITSKNIDLGRLGCNYTYCKYTLKISIASLARRTMNTNLLTH